MLSNSVIGKSFLPSKTSSVEICTIFALILNAAIATFLAPSAFTLYASSGFLLHSCSLAIPAQFIITSGLFDLQKLNTCSRLVISNTS